MKSNACHRHVRRNILACALFSVIPIAYAETGNKVLEYTIQPGDTLIQLGQRHLLQAQQWTQLQQENRITDPHRLKPGSRLRIPAKLLRHAPSELLLESVNGTVRWRKPDGDWQTAKVGDRLGEGVEISTSEDASASLRLADDSRILVSPQTTLMLDRLSLYGKGMMIDSRIRLQQGQTDINANPTKKANTHLEIKTPSAQTVVRGTQFRVAADDGVTREETLQGKVSVAGSGREVMVQRNKGTLVKVGEKPIPPVALLPAPDVSDLPTRFEQLPMRFPLPTMAKAQRWIGQIAPEPSFKEILLEKSSPGNTLVFADLPNGDYVLRIRASDQVGLQGADAQHRFTVFARPFAPGINSPGDAATIRNARAPFEWTKSLGVARYRLQLAQKSDFSTLLHDADSSDTRWLPASDLPAGQLYWRIASIDTTGLQGPWSSPAAFTYKPRPGPVDPGRISTNLLEETLQLELGNPPVDLAHIAVLSANPNLEPVLQEVQSRTGHIELNRPAGGTYYLGVGLIDQSDNTSGPKAVRQIEVPGEPLWPLLILLLPLL